MELVLDFGNTRVKLALFEGEETVLEQDLAGLSPEELVRFLGEYPGIDASILSSVITLPEEIGKILSSRTFFIRLDENTPVPVINRYTTPSSLGKDRLAAAVGGASLFPSRDVLVITAGTALTFDFVNAAGEYIGGSISPGMQMRFRALHTFTDRLPLLSFREPVGLAGDSTDDSILSGVVNGMAAEIAGIAAAYGSKYPGLQVILSGGDLNYFVKRLKISIFARPNIVVYGLRKILAFNVNHPR
ncbi:MAG TPA: type III pantothenate kinase [Bacteroidales bacterium]|nr:type III pantothenate kinase [Bacteroidales bacterium]